MNKYLKDNLILGDSLEIFFGWITLTHSTSFEIPIYTGTKKYPDDRGF